MFIKMASVLCIPCSVTNLGLSWLLCCRKLHTVIMKGNFQGKNLSAVNNVRRTDLGWPKWLKSLGTAGTSPIPILFTKLFWKMAKKFKNFGVLGCLIAVEEMADFTL